MAADKSHAKGGSELKAAMAKGRGLFLSVGLFSFFVNLLMLTGPLFMLQVYDRVLGSRSEATLVALVVLIAILYLIMGFLDYARGRVLARVGAEFQTSMDRRVFEAVLKRSVVPVERSAPASGLRDLESVQRLLSSPALFAVFDMPWVPIFIGAIFLFHPLLGYLAVAGGLILVSVTMFNQLLTRKPVNEANGMSAAADKFAESVREEGEMIQGLGMRGSVLTRWRMSRDKALEAQITSSDLTGTFSTGSKTFRLFLQSAMLGLGAYLVLQGEMTPGAMIAGSILLGRALSPIEQAIGQWPLVIRARQGWSSLSELLTKTPVDPERTELPAPRAILEGQQITVVPPGEQVATLRALDNYDPDALGQYIGYLPQDVALFNGSIAENIARLSMQPDPAQVVEAAKKAGAHEMILKMPDGYDTQISAGTGRLSGGQKQRIGLARAMYGVIGFIALIALVFGLGGWAAMANIAGAIVASGQIEVEANRQVVQHPEGGVVGEILADDGDIVDAGDVLVRFDDTLLRSELSIIEGQLFELIARRGRLEAERDGFEGIAFPEEIELLSPESEIDIQNLKAGQLRLLEARSESSPLRLPKAGAGSLKLKLKS